MQFTTVKHPFDGGLLFNPGYIVPKLVKTSRRGFF